MPQAPQLPGCSITCERTGRWAVALRRAMPEIVLRETRTAAECGDELAAAPASVVAIEVSAARLDEAAAFVADLAGRYPSARVVVVAERGLAQYEWLFRELGAAAWTDSPRDLAAVVAIARRHLAEAASPAPGIREQILARLPWSEA